MNPFDLTDEQVSNLLKLADHLERDAKPDTFGMDRFYARRTGEETNPRKAKRHPCGSVACAVGHGPSAGVPALPRESWIAYADRAFGDNQALWCSLFSGTWFRTDNTPKGAAARIRYALDTAVPVLRGETDYSAYHVDNRKRAL